MSFTWKDYQARINNELVAILGNFVNRVMILMHKYYDGIIDGDASLSDDTLNNQIATIYDDVEQNIESY